MILKRIIIGLLTAGLVSLGLAVQEASIIAEKAYCIAKPSDCPKETN